MIQNIPTHLIAGPLGAGKTTLLKQLMRQRPEQERWGILINEFGQIGIDSALLENDAQGVSLAEVPGGCLCCVNGLPFQVGLGRLLRKARPTRLFIESSGLGHPLQLLQQLAAPPWVGVLALQPLIMVLDAAQLASGKPLAESQRLALPKAGILLLNTSANLNNETRQQVAQLLPAATTLWCEDAQISLSCLPTTPAVADAAIAPTLEIPSSPDLLPVWRTTQDWHCLAQELNGHYSIGWRVHPDVVFHLEQLQNWLKVKDWTRAKGVVHTTNGWMAFNALPGETVAWQRSGWNKDSRIELLSVQSPNQHELEASLRAIISHP
ncbi:MAG TPA: CobW family GTP-binding protein [Halomonas sp.]|nr:CobW family GTP-binding protein [Halomonas sp.]